MCFIQFIEYRQIVGHITNIYELKNVNSLSIKNIHELKRLITLEYNYSVLHPMGFQ